MAGHDKTEAPTPRRREEARRKGQVARSVELSSVFVLMASFGVLQVSGQNMFQQMGTFMRKTFEYRSLASFDESSVAACASVASTTFIGVMAPVLLALVVVGLAINAAQTRLLFSTEALKPNFAKMNPIAGLQRMFSGRSLVELGKSLFKISVAGFIGCQILSERYSSFLLLQSASLATQMGTIAGVALELGFKVGAALLAMAGLDYLYQRQQFEKSLRMSRAELKEEFRSTEGDPQLKGRIRQMQKTLARRRMMQSVPQADVVVTNPTHLAVALKYDAARMAAPTVVAKGERFIADQIKRVAREHGVPILENKPLAQALFKMVDIGEQIPASLYQAVAEVLAFVYQLRQTGLRTVE
ncbi:MAG: flagellar biosynthesis protein FlhB [Chloroflexota bacterium]